jgi:hypothetical protein
VSAPYPEPIRIAKKSKIGRKVNRVEIDAPVGQAIRRNAHLIETEYLDIVWPMGLQLGNEAIGIKGGDENAPRAGSSQLSHGLCHMAENGAADSRYLLDI